MRRTWGTMLALLAMAGGLVLLGSPAGAQDLYNCDSFPSQADAQAQYDADTSDPNGLDGDGDGYACEDYFGEPSGLDPSDTGVPTAGPATGFGGLAPEDGSSGAPLALYGGAAALVAAGGGALLLRRRASASR